MHDEDSSPFQAQRQHGPKMIGTMEYRLTEDIAQQHQNNHEVQILRAVAAEYQPTDAIKVHHWHQVFGWNT